MNKWTRVLNKIGVKDDNDLTAFSVLSSTLIIFGLLLFNVGLNNPFLLALLFYILGALLFMFLLAFGIYTFLKYKSRNFE